MCMIRSYNVFVTGEGKKIMQTHSISLAESEMKREGGRDIVFSMVQSEN
jgi:hypothetical protein